VTQLLAMNTGNRTHSPTQRGDDLYETPLVAVRALLAVESLPQVIWEPAAGPGAIVRPLRATGRTVIATDLVDYGLEDSTPRVDFRMEQRAPEGCSAIVTNPPFKHAEEFVAKALDLCPEVYMLLRVAFLEGLRWEEDRDFGEHLARVWVFAPRLPMMHRAGWDGPVNSNSGMAFAWFVFHRNIRKMSRTGAQVHWINWRKVGKFDEVPA